MEIEINKLINEEVSKVLNEGYAFQNENFKFKHRLNNSTFYGYEGFSNDYDIDITESDILINWNVIFWLNEFGIENLVIQINGVSGTYTVEYLNKQTDETEQTTNKNISEIDWKFNIDDANLTKGGTLYVTDLSFNFKTNTCDVNFTNKNY